MRPPSSSPQPFARGQNQPFQNGPYLGGEIYLLPSNVSAGGSVTFTHNLRAFPRHVEVVAPIHGEYPSRLAVVTANTATMTVQFESAQSANAALWVW